VREDGWKNAGDVAVQKYGQIVVKNKQMAGGFIQLPKFILLNKDLSTTAKLCYAGLLNFAWQEDHCFPGIIQFSDTIGLNKDTASKGLKDLETSNFIKIKRWGQGKNNTYYLLDRT